jgi:hypothetical protein
MDFDIVGLLQSMSAVAQAFKPLLVAAGYTTGLLLIALAAKLMIESGGPHSKYDSAPLGIIATHCLIAGFLMSFTRTLQMMSLDLLAGVGGDARTALAYVAPQTGSGGVWALALNACFLWVGAMGAIAVYRGLWKWHSLGSGDNHSKGDEFWAGLWHILFGGIAVNMGRFV